MWVVHDDSLSACSTVDDCKHEHMVHMNHQRAHTTQCSLRVTLCIHPPKGLHAVIIFCSSMLS